MRCKICNNNKTYDVLNLKKQPLANKYPKNKFEVVFTAFVLLWVGLSHNIVQLSKVSFPKSEDIF